MSENPHPERAGRIQERKTSDYGLHTIHAVRLDQPVDADYWISILSADAYTVTSYEWRDDDGKFHFLLTWKVRGEIPERKTDWGWTV